MGILAAIYYWFPKMFGSCMNERIGIIQFILLLIGMNLTFMPMHFLGVEGMPRRIYTYGAEQGWTYWNQVTTIGAHLITLKRINIAVAKPQASTRENIKIHVSSGVSNFKCIKKATTKKNFIADITAKIGI